MLLELSVQEATTSVPIDSLFPLMMTCLPPETLISCKCKEITGGVVSLVSLVSFISSVQSDPHEMSAVVSSNVDAQMTVAINEATNDFLIIWSLFVQVIMFCCSRYGQIRSS